MSLPTYEEVILVDFEIVYGYTYDLLIGLKSHCHKLFYFFEKSLKKYLKSASEIIILNTILKISVCTYVFLIYAKNSRTLRLVFYCILYLNKNNTRGCM